MKLSEDLTWRGLVGQTTYDNLSKLDDNQVSFYLGVDPSADSMTIGNLAAAMLARRFVDSGHKAYLLVGGATGLIGDPDGKADERNTKSFEEIAKNKAGIAAQYKTIFAGKNFTLVDNYDWFKDINYLDFLRDVGKYMPMSQMLDREFVKTRLGESGTGLSYAEFSYALIQGFDFVHLFRKHGVTLQICGADQWGNCVAGIDLIRRIEGKEANIYSIPLVINKSTGVKFGKSEGGAVWLDSNKTSVYKFYQFWLNADDQGVIDYLKVFTLLDRQKIEELEQKTHENPGAREAQKTLAYEVTKLVHGQERTESVMRVTSVLFGGADFSTLGSSDLDELAAEIPTATVGKTIVDSLVESGCAASNGEGRRLIMNGAISLNGNKIDNNITIGSTTLIKKGKNSFVLVR